jgi:hypothetical protein
MSPETQKAGILALQLIPNQKRSFILFYSFIFSVFDRPIVVVCLANLRRLNTTPPPWLQQAAE